jgi:hypothetical protein
MWSVPRGYKKAKVDWLSQKYKRLKLGGGQAYDISND